MTNNEKKTLDNSSKSFLTKVIIMSITLLKNPAPVSIIINLKTQ